MIDTKPKISVVTGTVFGVEEGTSIEKAPNYALNLLIDQLNRNGPISGQAERLNLARKELERRKKGEVIIRENG